MLGLVEIVTVCIFANVMTAGAIKPCCISKRWNGTMRLTRATVAPGSAVPLMTTNDFEFVYDKDMRMERVRGEIRTENGTMDTSVGYLVYNDYRNMNRYVLDISGKCRHEKITTDQVSNCVPSTATLVETVTLGSSSEGVMVNVWSSFDGLTTMNMLTTVNDCTPVTMSRFGTMPDGTKFSEDTVYVNVHQYTPNTDAFKLPPACMDDPVIPVGK